MLGCLSLIWISSALTIEQAEHQLLPPLTLDGADASRTQSAIAPPARLITQRRKPRAFNRASVQGVRQPEHDAWKQNQDDQHGEIGDQERNHAAINRAHRIFSAQWRAEGKR